VCVCVQDSRCVPSARSALLAVFSVFLVHFISGVRTCYSRIKVFKMIPESNAIGNLPKIKFVDVKSYSLQLVLAFYVFITISVYSFLLIFIFSLYLCRLKCRDVRHRCVVL
jgi:hypothetical protein